MNKLLSSLTIRQRITIVVTILLAATGIYALVHWRQEADFRPLFTGLAAEDAAGIVQKLKETGVEYRVPEEGGAVLVPSAHLAELRLSLAAAGLPKSGRIGFELFDKTNLGATEFTEHVNYGRALEGELERSVMSLTEVDQARVHITFPKDSVFLDAQKPAKASVLVHLKPGAHLSPQNVQAINHLVAAAVEGLSPDGVSVLDMNGNLLGRPRTPGSIDGPEPSEAGLDYRRKIEADLVAKVNSTLEPLLGAEKFHAGVSVDCDFNGGEQSEEVFDPARSVMLSSQRTEDTSGSGTGTGVPGTASTLPRPTSHPSAGANRVSRVTENVTYQSSRTVKKMRLPAGAIRKISVAVLVDQELTWEKDKNGLRRVLTPPSAEKLKVIHDLVAGVTGFNTERGDQLVVETQPFETTLTLDPPLPPGASGPGRPGTPEPAKLLQLDRKTLMIGGGVLAAVVVILVLFLRRGRGAPAEATVPMELPAGTRPAVAPGMDQEVRSRLAEHDAQQAEAEAQAALKLVPAITKTAEVMAKHLREKVAQSPDVSVQVLRGWIRDEDPDR
jgi:flagellar M-ring protein FliF